MMVVAVAVAMAAAAVVVVVVLDDACYRMQQYVNYMGAE